MKLVWRTSIKYMYSAISGISKSWNNWQPMKSEDLKWSSDNFNNLDKMGKYVYRKIGMTLDAKTFETCIHRFSTGWFAGHQCSHNPYPDGACFRITMNLYLAHPYPGKDPIWSGSLKRLECQTRYPSRVSDQCGLYYRQGFSGKLCGLYIVHCPAEITALLHFHRNHTTFLLYLLIWICGIYFLQMQEQ